MKAVLEDGKLYAPKIWESPGVYGDGYVEVDPSDPEYDEWMAEVTHSADVWEMTAASWDESAHPRDPKGVTTGGRFTSKRGTHIGNGSELEQALANFDPDDLEEKAFLIERAYDLGYEDKLPESWRRPQLTLVEDKPASSEPAMGLGPPGRAEAVAAQGRTPDKETRDAWEANLKVFMDEAPVLMRVPESAMMEVFNDGEFYNQHQSGEARGMPRDVKSEASMLGVPDFDNVGPEDLPKYGYMGGDTDATNMYGAIKITFKDEVKDRATFTIGDSLMTNPLPSAMRDPRWQSVQTSGSSADPMTDWHENLMNGDLEYMEAQIYGKLTPDDIESVEILDESYWEDEDPLTGQPLVENVGQLGAVMDELTKRKIPWSTYIPEGDFSGEFA